MNGLERIAMAFERAHQENRAALMPYYTLGFPTLAGSRAVVQSLAHAGADLIELGIPFSDPLADGPTIQHSTQVALQNGITVEKCLEMVAELRSTGMEQPMLLMGYINPLLAYGVREFVNAAAQAGADGFIIPDLPPEEAVEMEAACGEHGCALVYLAAPNSSAERLRLVAERSSGFVYLVSVTGVTGARQELPDDLAAFVQRARAATRKPLAVGFGISTPEQARLVGQLADGVIVGSALINAARENQPPEDAVRNLVLALQDALAAPVNE